MKVGSLMMVPLNGWPVRSPVWLKATSLRRGQRQELRALPRDRSRRRIEHDLTFQWQIVEGPGALAGMHNQAVTFLAPDEP